MSRKVALNAYSVAMTERPHSALANPALRAVLPALTLIAYGAALALDRTHAAAVALVQENRPVELATFALLAAAGVAGLWHASVGRLRSEPAWVRLFHGAFGLAMVVVAGEEVAWGQWFFGFATPEAVAAANAQGELTLHNVGALQGRSELFRVAFGAAGLFGVWLAAWPRWCRVAAPRAMVPLLLTILVASLLDMHADMVEVVAYDRGWRWTSEVVEMLIGAAALMYALRPAPPTAPPARRAA